MKGQSGYAILAPVTARFASSNPADPDSWRRLARGEKPGFGEAVRSKLVGLKPAHVWDISQTDGEPDPRDPAPDAAARPGARGSVGRAGGSDHRARLRAAAGLQREVDRRSQRADRLHDPRGVGADGHGRRRPGQDARPRARARHAPRPRQRRRRHAPRHRRGRGRVASPSWSAPRTGWRPTTTRSRTSPRGPASVPGKTPVEVVQSTAERVRGAAVTILDKLDTPQVGDGNPPGLDREALAAGRGAAPVQTVAQRQVEPIGL